MWTGEQGNAKGYPALEKCSYAVNCYLHGISVPLSVYLATIGKSVTHGYKKLSDYRFVKTCSLWSNQLLCSCEIKRCLLLGRKGMTNLDSVLKSRDIILLTKIYIVKTVAFPVIMYGCESWTIRKAEHGRIDAFELWCWKRLLKVPWTARRSNQSVLKQINPEYSLKDWRRRTETLANSLENTLMLGKIEGRRRRVNSRWDGWMASLT